MSLQVTIQHHALDQCEVLVAGRRVGYYPFGEGRRLIFLSTRYLKDSKTPLSIEEKLAIIRAADEVMSKLNKERAARAEDILAQLPGETLPDDFYKPEPVTVSTASKKPEPAKS